MILSLEQIDEALCGMFNDAVGNHQKYVNYSGERAIENRKTIAQLS